MLDEEGTNNDEEDPANKAHIITTTEEEMSNAARQNLQEVDAEGFTIYSNEEIDPKLP